MATATWASKQGGAGQPGSAWTMAAWVVWIGSLVLGSAGLYMRAAQGHLPAGYGSYVPWGLWIALYFHGIGIAGGAFILAGLGYLLDRPGFRRPAVLRTAIVLSVAAIAPAFLAVWLDLGHMERAYRIFTSPRFTSMMAFNAWLYGVFLVVVVLCWKLSFARESGWLKPLLCLGMFLSIVIPSQSGAFFGVVEAKSFWHSGLFPVLFLASAFTSGAAMLLLVNYLMEGDGPEEAGQQMSYTRMALIKGMLVYFALEFAELSVALWNPNGNDPAIRLILTGPYWWVFWLVHLALGGVLPLILLATRSRRAWVVASLLIAITFVSSRLNVLIPGQAVGELQGLQDAFQHERLSYIYNATAMEYLVGLFLVAAGMTVFYLGLQMEKSLSGRKA